MNRYSAPNAQSYPAVTRREILPFYKRLIARFGRLSEMPVGVAETRGHDYTRNNARTARACWASLKPTIGHNKGWGRMIHDASHEIFAIRHPHARPHDGGHAALEREMSEFVAAHEWPHTVTMRRQLNAQSKARPTYAERVYRLTELIERWESKQRRAVNAIERLRRKARALERLQNRRDAQRLTQLSQERITEL